MRWPSALWGVAVARARPLPSPAPTFHSATLHNYALGRIKMHAERALRRIIMHANASLCTLVSALAADKRHHFARQSAAIRE